MAIGLTTWLRSPVYETPLDLRQALFADRLAVPDAAIGPDVTLLGAWHLRSPNAMMSGLSALLAMGDDTLLAISDHRHSMRMAAPGGPRSGVAIDNFELPGPGIERLIDLEAATRDPSTGTIWVAFEGENQIERYAAGGIQARRRPPEMRSWWNNSGPEAMVRLSDGRFVVLAEGNPRWFASGMPGLVFAGDPVDGAKGERFRFVPPGGFRPVDMAELPDGRVAILLRTVLWAWPQRFEGKLVVADPRAIAPGQPWEWSEIGTLAEPLPMDNYEGLAVEPAAGGGVVLWVISDDNRSAFQRTLLLKLLWQPNERARGSPHAP